MSVYDSCMQKTNIYIYKLILPMLVGCRVCGTGILSSTQSSIKGIFNRSIINEYEDAKKIFDKDYSYILVYKKKKSNVSGIIKVK